MSIEASIWLQVGDGGVFTAAEQAKIGHCLLFKPISVLILSPGVIITAACYQVLIMCQVKIALCQLVNLTLETIL